MTPPPSGDSSASSTPAAAGSRFVGASSASTKVLPPVPVPGPGSAKVATPLPPIRQPNTSATPVVVPPNAVKRTSGDLPKISTIVRPGTEVPKSLSAKICIDAAGKVTNVQIFKVTGDLADKLASAIRDWRYTTHKIDGRAVPACFVNSFPLK